ncbi:MAG TPA: hypothetical protein VK607_10495 [Kofleriaceae bacterium]|nr:hypothetical protein [Kofleriaceae bacterium]
MTPQFDFDILESLEHEAQNPGDELLLRALTREEARDYGVIVCSCGCYTCPAIVLFGLPVAEYHDTIEPLADQTERDRKAAELKAGA